MMDLEVINTRGQNVYRLDEATLVLVSGGPTVQINQADPTGDRKFDYDAVYLSKNQIIKMASHLLIEGANHDLSYQELCKLIKVLEAQRDR